MAIGPHGGAVDPLPTPLFQPLEHLSELRADHQRPAEERLQVVPGHVFPGADPRRHDQLALLAILVHADGFGLEDAHTLHLCHVAEVLHPALDRVHLEGVHAGAVGEPRANQLMVTFVLVCSITEPEEETSQSQRGQIHDTVSGSLASITATASS